MHSGTHNVVLLAKKDMKEGREQGERRGENWPTLICHALATICVHALNQQADHLEISRLAKFHGQLAGDASG